MKGKGATDVVEPELVNLPEDAVRNWIATHYSPRGRVKMTEEGIHFTPSGFDKLLKQLSPQLLFTWGEAVAVALVATGFGTCSIEVFGPGGVRTSLGHSSSMKRTEGELVALGFCGDQKRELPGLVLFTRPPHEPNWAWVRPPD